MASQEHPFEIVLAVPDNVILETGAFLYHFTICLHGRERSDRETWVSPHHFRALFPFQLGGCSGPEMIGRMAKEAGNLVDLFRGGGSPESGPLLLRPHVLMAPLVEGWEKMSKGREPH
jgi:hypothetical protein